ncbi:MAG: hypothetical protein HRU16_07930, partial [Planctomycetes bacterium]|nr:hypothetical protein [Planctomycetota bacterium]
MKQLSKTTGMGTAILQKELIVRMRKFRSLVIQLVFAAILGGAMWIYSLTSAIGGATSPEDHAQSLVTVYFGVQLAALFLIIPALGAVSITTERLGRTWDLLIGTDLSPGEIVRGKLLGILSITFYIMFLPAPLLALTTLFGGVSIGAILFEYFVHMLLALLLGSCAILSSAASKGTARAILQVYPLAAIGLMFSMGYLTNFVYSEGLLILDYLVLYAVWEFWLIAIPLYLFAVIGTLVGSTYFLSGVESAREIPVRVLFLAVFVIAVGLYLYGMLPYVSASSYGSLSRAHGEALTVALVFLPLVVLRLAGSETRVPLRVAQIYRKGHMASRFGYFLLPGGLRNLLLAIGLYSIPFAMVWFIAGLEQSTLSQVSDNFDHANYQARLAKFEGNLSSIYLWGMSVLALGWFFAQVGFGGIVSSVLALGIHVALAMFVTTMMVMTGGPTASMFLSPPLMLTDRIDMQMLIKANLFSSISLVVCVLFGMVLSRRKGI